MLFVYTKQGGVVKYEKNSGGTLDFQRTPDVMCLASVAGKGRPDKHVSLQNKFDSNSWLILLSMKLSSLKQVTHLKDIRLDVTNEEYGTDSSAHLMWYFDCLNYGQQDTAHSRRVQLPLKPKEKQCNLSTWSSSILKQSSQLQCPTSHPCFWANKN